MRLLTAITVVIMSLPYIASAQTALVDISCNTKRETYEFSLFKGIEWDRTNSPSPEITQDFFRRQHLFSVYADGVFADEMRANRFCVIGDLSISSAIDFNHTAATVCTSPPQDKDRVDCVRHIPNNVIVRKIDKIIADIDISANDAIHISLLRVEPNQITICTRQLYKSATCQTHAVATLATKPLVYKARGGGMP